MAKANLLIMILRQIKIACSIKYKEKLNLNLFKVGKN